MTLPPIAIFHVETVSPEEFSEFRDSVSRAELQVSIVSREPAGPMAGLEWLTPTVVIGFIASAYFGGFFQELGKDHYSVVKHQFQKLYQKVAGPEAPEVKIVSSAGKLGSSPKYSLYFSVIGESPDGVKLKLLIPRPISKTEYDLMIELFLNYLLAINSQDTNPEILRKLQESNPIGRTALLIYDKESGHIEPINARTGETVR